MRAVDALLEFRGVRKSFDQHEVLRGVSFVLPKGTTLAVMGGSGVGKTVLLRLCAGLARPDAGEVRLLGQRIEGLREEQILSVRRRTGFVFQGAALFDSLTVFENVAFPLREHTSWKEAQIADKVRRFLTLVGLPGTEDLWPAELSGGMRKRVGIARALVLEPEVVFFDEPTAGLDPTNARVVADLIVHLRSGVCDTAVVVTHDVEFADIVADQMAILHQGRFVAMGTPKEIQSSEVAAVQAFLAGQLHGN